MSKDESITTELLECSLCLEMMFPPIYQCKEGHTICSSCQPKLKACHICRCATTDIRCRVLEKLAESIETIPCAYTKFGCSYTSKFSQKKEHENKCSFRPLPCLHGPEGCSFEGNVQRMVEHLIVDHNYKQNDTHLIRYTCNASNVTERTTPSSPSSAPSPRNEEKTDYWLWQNQLYHCHNKYYVLRVHRKPELDGLFYISLSAIHPRHHLNRYTVYVAGNFRRYSFEGPVWSSRKNIKEIERVKDCLMIPENIALFLSGGKGSENDFSSLQLTVEGEIFSPLSA